jgi:hypothetical protein
MTGGRAFICDPTRTAPAAVDATSVTASPLDRILEERDDGDALRAELADLVLAHAEAGSALAGHLVALGGPDPRTTWVVEPRRTPDQAATAVEPARPGLPEGSVAPRERTPAVAGPAPATSSQPSRPRLAVERAVPGR